MENEEVKLLWDFNVQTDRTIETRRSDLIVIVKIEDGCKITDLAVPGDTRIGEKEGKKRKTQRPRNGNR